MSLIVLSIDPGRSKCGIAIVTGAINTNLQPKAIHREIIATERLIARVLQLLKEYTFTIVLLGDGTQSAPLFKALREVLALREELGITIELVPEAFTSQRARVRLQKESLPRGIARFVPAGMRTLPKPYDDYVALILAEDWFLTKNESSPVPPQT